MLTYSYNPFVSFSMCLFCVLNFSTVLPGKLTVALLKNSTVMCLKLEQKRRFVFQIYIFQKSQTY